MNVINESEIFANKEHHSHEAKYTNMVFDGDSIALGVGAADKMGLASQVSKMLDIPLTIHVIAQGGRRLTSCLSSFKEKVFPLYENTAANNVLFIKAGDNDVTGGISIDQIYKALVDYVCLAHQQGWKTVVATNLQRYDIPTDLQEKLSMFNRFVRENTSHAGSVADFAEDSVMGGRENRNNILYYINDEVHPSDEGYTILACHVVRALYKLNILPNK